MAEMVLDSLGVPLAADMVVPAHATGVVLFAHGSGSSRHSPRDRAVAEELNRHGLATVLADLLTPEEERVDAVDGRLRFDIRLLSRRVIGAVEHLGPKVRLPLGLFGASTGGAAALVAAAARPDTVRAVVSRGGRVDLAGPALGEVRAPTLLIVGQNDPAVLDLNERARHLVAGPTELHVVPGATHLFEEPGALAQVATRTAGWFARELPTR